MCWYWYAESESCSVVSDSLPPHVGHCIQSMNSLGQNTGVGSLSLLQGIFTTQGSNPGLPHCRWILYQLSHKGSPRILGWVAYPFSSRSSWPRNQTGVSCIAGRFFTNWAIREAHWYTMHEIFLIFEYLKIIRKLKRLFCKTTNFPQLNLCKQIEHNNSFRKSSSFKYGDKSLNGGCIKGCRA